MVVTGRGRFFCAGGDVQGFSAAGDKLPEFLREITSYLHSALSSLMRMNKPLVSAVNGPVAGGGIGLAIAGDIVLADPSAHFTLAYTGIGLSPDGGSSWLLPTAGRPQARAGAVPDQSPASARPRRRSWGW